MIRCDIKDGCHNNSFIWVSDERKLLWYEIPKNASTSIKSQIKDFKRVDEYISEYDSYFKFCVVRNPWDRMASNWRMYCYTQSKGDVIKDIFNVQDKRLTFKDFIMKSIEMRNHHWESQYKFIGKIDKFFKLEEFNGSEVGLTIPKMNSTNKKHYMDYYNDELIEIVTNEYKKDIEIFGYELHKG